MVSAQTKLLELTRSAIWETEPKNSIFEDPTNWNQILKLATQQTLQGLVSVAIEKLPRHLAPTRIETLKLHQTVAKNRQLYAQHTKALAKIIELAKQAGATHPVLLKGLGLGLNYPDPTLRMCGDIDLYVGSKHYDKLQSLLLKELKIPKSENISAHHFAVNIIGTPIEIHQYPTDPNNIAFNSNKFISWCTQQLEGEQLRRVEIEGVEVYLPPYNFDFIYIFYHSWRHLLTGGVGLRQLCDWGCYVSKFADKFDKTEIRRVIELLKLQTPISIFASIAVNELGVDPNKFADIAHTNHKHYNKALNKIWEGGNFGSYNKIRETKSHTVLQRKWRSFKVQLHTMAFMMGIDWRYTTLFYTKFFAARIASSLKHHKSLANRL